MHTPCEMRSKEFTMAAMPPRKPSATVVAPRQPPVQPTQPEEVDPAAAAEDGSPDESYLNYGASAKQAVKNSQEANAFRGYREFFITKKDMTAAAQKGEQGVTARVHFIRNYANPLENVSVPRCTIKTQQGFDSYTSPGADCALAAAGVPVSIRPVYLMIDHRTYAKKDNTTGCDDLKLFIPPPNFMGIMENAIKNLAENLGVDPSQVDITKHEAKLSKIASGRNTTWAVDFVIQPKGLSKIAVENITKGFGTDGYKKTLAKWLAPNPRYMISRGGNYIMPPRQPQQGSVAQHGNEEPPY